MATLIGKREVHDVDVMYPLSRHDGVSKQVKTQLRAYRKRCTNGNQITLTYDFGKDNRAFRKGRVSPDPYTGLAVFPREIRAALAQKFYWDLDVVNAQPVILSQFAKKSCVATPALDEYCENRVQILKEIMEGNNLSRDEAKDLCIATLFGGFRASHPLLPRMYAELHTLSSFT